MIQCKLVDNAHFSLKEREILSGTLSVDENQAHVMLKTCNRTEIYWGEGTVPETILRHLYRIASGLESGIIGEHAIQGQLKSAYLMACEKYPLSSSIHRLFQTAIRTGRRVRNETCIALGAISHSQVAIDLLKKEQIDLTQKVVSIIGVNKITEDILKFLTANRSVNIFLANRNVDKAAALAEKYHGTAVPLHHKKSMLDFTDVLISATSAPHYLVGKRDIHPDKEILIIDLAFPRDIDPALSAYKQVKLFDLEAVEQYARHNLSMRTNEIERAEQIIEEEICKFNTWISHLQPQYHSIS
jgi:glutamyl-tRNA reductase